VIIGIILVIVGILALLLICITALDEHFASKQQLKQYSQPKQEQEVMHSQTSDYRDAL
jgi:hypothetical protein